jgi:ABC-type uncharacterized transport system permease subunit
MKPVATQPADLGRQISAGHLVAVGDDVEVVTADGAKHRFRIAVIDKVTINGADVTIPIDTIVGLRVRKFSEGKTALMAGGISASLIALFVTAMSGLAIAGMAGP